ncbi:hypothetical protein [Aurantiacibacter spongiae]|uniref:Uncharacterized protein n=1 Tax=Aurantiacibacter spongiae TaxID=2488860 RepID=A0A3N5CP69_9SPHN|nr:hypothetical protein [Aurantiacibacter spongiae]RPF70377.1 hypothetical protein EG799_01070 [Aurantiacibacter spongiae]
MTVKALECDHVTKHRDGSSTAARLSAYKKAGAYKVAKGDNRVENELALDTLDEVLPYMGKGYMVRMRSEVLTISGRRRRIEGLYGADKIEVIR